MSGDPRTATVPFDPYANPRFRPPRARDAWKNKAAINAFMGAPQFGAHIVDPNAPTIQEAYAAEPTAEQQRTMPAPAALNWLASLRPADIKKLPGGVRNMLASIVNDPVAAMMPMPRGSLMAKEMARQAAKKEIMSGRIRTAVQRGNEVDEFVLGDKIARLKKIDPDRTKYPEAWELAQRATVEASNNVMATGTPRTRFTPQGPRLDVPARRKGELRGVVGRTSPPASIGSPLEGSTRVQRNTGEPPAVPALPSGEMRTVRPLEIKPEGHHEVDNLRRSLGGKRELNNTYYDYIDPHATMSSRSSGELREKLGGLMENDPGYKQQLSKTLDALGVGDEVTVYKSVTKSDHGLTRGKYTNGTLEYDKARRYIRKFGASDAKGPRTIVAYQVPRSAVVGIGGTGDLEVIIRAADIGGVADIGKAKALNAAKSYRFTRQGPQGDIPQSPTK